MPPTWRATALSAATASSAEDQRNHDGLHGHTGHRSDVHGNLENGRSGFVLGAHGGGPLTGTPEIAFSADVTSGSYSPLALTGTATESFTGGATCGEKVGKKAAKPIKKGHIQRSHQRC